MAEAPRDTANAIALGMVIGEWRAQRGGVETNWPERWQNIGWDEIVNDIDEAAAMLDIVQRSTGNPVEFWEMWDWYLTVDAIGAELWRDPSETWTTARMVKCLRDGKEKSNG